MLCIHSLFSSWQPPWDGITIPVSPREAVGSGTRGSVTSFGLVASHHQLLLFSRWAASHSLQPARLPSPWDSPGRNTRVGCHFLLQRIFLTQGSNLRLLLGRRILYHWATREAQPPVLLPQKEPEKSDILPEMHRSLGWNEGAGCRLRHTGTPSEVMNCHLFKSKLYCSARLRGKVLCCFGEFCRGWWWQRAVSPRGSPGSRRSSSLSSDQPRVPHRLSPLSVPGAALSA